VARNDLYECSSLFCNDRSTKASLAFPARLLPSRPLVLLSLSALLSLSLSLSLSLPLIHPHFSLLFPYHLLCHFFPFCSPTNCWTLVEAGCFGSTAFALVVLTRFIKEVGVQRAAEEPAPTFQNVLKDKIFLNSFHQENQYHPQLNRGWPPFCFCTSRVSRSRQLKRTWTLTHQIFFSLHDIRR
jgi:hypothetical protein